MYIYMYMYSIGTKDKYKILSAVKGMFCKVLAFWITKQESRNLSPSE
jgi:lipid-A-disaccharide synthase-like uncharacterized protein